MTMEEKNKRLLELIDKHRDFEHALMFAYFGFLENDKSLPIIFVQGIKKRVSDEYKNLKEELRSIKNEE